MRSGNILLTIRAAGDSAFGDVVMEQPREPMPQSSADPRVLNAMPIIASRLLPICFVSIARGMVSGSVGPYVVPDCQCMVRSVFVGVVVADTVSGTFTTRSAISVLQTGRWRAVRKKSW
jgi:hypothetical protein